ncbi:MAG: sensor histidine kinase [Steroidobacter sp.]
MSGNTRSLHEQQGRAAPECDATTNADLERRLAQRTAELATAQRQLDAFSYSVAHDLRAPLRLIHAHIQMLREYEGPPDAREPQIHLDQIQRGAKQMSTLIDGILALARLSQVELKREPTSLGALVDQALNQLGPDASGREIDWRIGALPTTTCDPGLMLQVFVNLIGNAMKYSRGRSHIRIEIGTDAEGGENHIFIRDNGVGFDMRYAGKLFGAFQRLHRQDEFEGAGVGLAIAHRIIERHGGRIWADAAVGEGAVFRFTLAGMD